MILQESVPPLKPSGHHAMVVVSDLDGQALGRMRKDGLTPALIVETDTKTYQAWIRFGDEDKVLSEDQRATISKVLVREYGGDIAHDDYGRMAGFANHGRQFEDGGRPFCVLCQADGKPAPAAEKQIDIADQIIDRAKIDKVREARIECIGKMRSGLSAAEKEYKRQMQAIEQKYDLTGDKAWQRADSAAVMGVAKKGYDAEEIKQALINNR